MLYSFFLDARALPERDINICDNVYPGKLLTYGRCLDAAVWRDYTQRNYMYAVKHPDEIQRSPKENKYFQGNDVETNIILSARRQRKNLVDKIEEVYSKKSSFPITLEILPPFGDATDKVRPACYQRSNWPRNECKAIPHERDRQKIKKVTHERARITLGWLENSDQDNIPKSNIFCDYADFWMSVQDTFHLFIENNHMPFPICYITSSTLDRGSNDHELNHTASVCKMWDQFCPGDAQPIILDVKTGKRLNPDFD